MHAALTLARCGTVALVATGGGGGGDTPTPLVSADFKNGVYSIGGVSKTLGEVWENNAQWTNGQPAFDPASVEAGVGLATGTGHAAAASNLALTAAAFAGSGSGEFVAVFTMTLGSNAQFYSAVTNLPSQTDGWLFNADNSNQFNIGDYGTAYNAAGTALGSHKVAVLLSAADLSMSVDGGAAVSGGAAQTNADRNAYGMSLNYDIVIEKIEFFSLTDYTAADLPGLSAP